MATAKVADITGGFRFSLVASFRIGFNARRAVRDEQGPRFVRQTDEERWAKFIEESYETDEERARFAALPSVDELLAGRTALIKAIINDAERLVVLEAGTCLTPFWPAEKEVQQQQVRLDSSDSPEPGV